MEDYNMDKISKGDVFAGDVILYHGNSLISKLIRFFDGTDVNHAAICIGNGKVGEALGEGLTKRSIDAGIEDDEYAIVRRLKTDPGTMKPVADKAEYYLDIGNRYGYEQILLLAFLGLTRKLHVNSYLKWLMRKILDQATEWLMKHGSKQPMICSEFVYRCYDEALPVAHDPYFLDVSPFPGNVKTTKAGASAAAGRNRKMHRDSLLAWTEDIMIKSGRSANDVLLRSLEDGTARQMKKKLSSEEKRLQAMPLDKLINKYLEEIKRPKAKSLELESSLRDPEMLKSIKRFSEAFYSATKNTRSKAKESWLAKGAEKQLPAALDHLLATVADFVTPGDLYYCADLYSVGRLVSKRG